MSQEISKDIKFHITMDFETQWHYFRMKRNPLLSYEETHDGANWKIPFLIPEKFYVGYYEAELKISRWGPAKTPRYVGDVYYPFVDMHDPNYYLVEKKDGLLGIKRAFMTDSIIDTMQLNIYDSIFPYDNRFLAVVKNNDKYGDPIFRFHSGNVEWGEWRDAHYRHSVDYCGYIRGVQFSIENVIKFNQGFSDKIKQFRPEYPDYVYTANRYSSLLTPMCVIIGAPQGKEDQLIEYIYYCNIPEKTGDPDLEHYYEMRYILPTQITSIKERRLEKRLLTDEEKNYIFDDTNEMFYYVERYVEPDVEIILDAPK
ncbi:MAG: hypothetical protein LBU84_04900 [Prevotella sp.]|jgi:hypothetical protein|nr:hypothetical protein [Prevotella sp.]